MRAKEMNFATLPCLRKVAISHPERNFPLQCAWRSAVSCCSWPALLFTRSQEGKGKIDVCQGQAFFSPIYQLSLASCYCLALFLGKGWSLSVFRLCNEVTSSQDQAHFLLHRPKSGQECSSVQISWWFTCQGGWFCFLGDWEPSLPFLQTSTEYLTICKYYVSLWCTLCSCLFLNQNACLGGDKRI